MSISIRRACLPNIIASLTVQITEKLMCVVFVGDSQELQADGVAAASSSQLTVTDRSCASGDMLSPLGSWRGSGSFYALLNIGSLWVAAWAAPAGGVRDAPGWGDLKGCEELDLVNQPLCYFVGATPDQRSKYASKLRRDSPYDPIKWLATRQRVNTYAEAFVTPNTFGKTRNDFDAVAAPDVAIKASVSTNGYFATKTVSVFLEVDAIWCNDQHCSSMVDLVIDFHPDEADAKQIGLTGLLQMQEGSYFGVSAAGSKVKGSRRIVRKLTETDNHDFEYYRYQAESPYESYQATDAIIGGSLLRAFAATNLQGTYGVKTKYARLCGDQCARVLYSGNPCTGLPDIGLPHMFEYKPCTHPTSTIVILPNTTHLSGRLLAAERAAARDQALNCAALRNCTADRLGACLEAVCEHGPYKQPYSCKRRVWQVQLYDAEGMKVGTGTAFDLQDPLWRFKTDRARQQAWSKERVDMARLVAAPSSRVWEEGRLDPEPTPFDIMAYALLTEARHYPSMCQKYFKDDSTSLLDELLEQTLFVNCSYSTEADVYEGTLARTDTPLGKCVSGDLPKYEFYSNKHLVNHTDAFSLYEGFTAKVLANTSDCIRLHAPASRYCRSNGVQLLEQLHSYGEQLLSSALSVSLAGTTVTNTYILGNGVTSLICLLGAIASYCIIVTSYVTSSSPEPGKGATSVAHSPATRQHSKTLGSVAMESQHLLGDVEVASTPRSGHAYGSCTGNHSPGHSQGLKSAEAHSFLNPFKEVFSSEQHGGNAHGKRAEILVAWLLYVVFAVPLCLSMWSNCSAELDNQDGSYQQIGAEALQNDRYDSQIDRSLKRIHFYLSTNGNSPGTRSTGLHPGVCVVIHLHASVRDFPGS